MEGILNGTNGGHDAEGSPGADGSRHDRDDDAIRAPVAACPARCRETARPRRPFGQRVGKNRKSEPNYLKILWRRRESNTGPAMSQESAGASRRVVSAEKSVVWGDSRESASAWENAGESRGCNNVANGPTAAELLELIDAGIVALDTGETEVARAQLQALAKAVQARDQGVSHRR